MIADLYMGAKTRFMIAGGETADIEINRGTLQGDSLSPLLFIIFMEPLLRWLQSGGRDYKFACSTGKQQALTAGSCAYADDLGALIGNGPDLAIQGTKVDRYSDWGGLGVDAQKSAVSAIRMDELPKRAMTGQRQAPQ